MLPSQAVSTATAVAIIGLCLGAVNPLFYELGVELTFPAPELVSSGFVSLVRCCRCRFVVSVCVHPSDTTRPLAFACPFRSCAPCVSQANNVWALVFLFALPAIGARTINVVFLCGMAATTLLTVCVREEYRRQDREARVHTAEGPGMDGDEILKIAAGTPQLSSSQTPTSVASVDTPLLP